MLDLAVKDALDKFSIAYEVRGCDSDFADTAAYCEKYNFPLESCANTILVADKKDSDNIAACVVLATDRLDVNKKVRKLINAKKVSFASAEKTTELTGMKIGGVVAFGLPSRIPILIDQKVMARPGVIMGGGNRSSKVLLKPAELQKLSNHQIVDISLNPVE